MKSVFSAPPSFLRRNPVVPSMDDSESVHSVGKCHYLKAYFHLVSGRTFCVNVLP